MEKRLKGVDGWLLFFIISLVFLSPLYAIFINQEFYFYESGALAYENIVFSALFVLWGVTVGVLLWRKSPKAVIWAKEYLIAAFVLNLFLTLRSYSYFNEEDQIVLLSELIRGVGYFIIWFWYLNVSVRIKNTFAHTKLNWKRVIAVTSIAITVSLVIATLVSYIPLDIENPSAVVYEPRILEPGTIDYYGFLEPEIAVDIYVDFQSIGGPIEVYLVKNEEDLDRFSNNENFEIYSGCSKTGAYTGAISCTVSSGGVLVYNPNDIDVEYTLQIK